MKRLIENINGKDNNPKTLFEIIRIGNILNVRFEAYDSDLISFSNKHNDQLYKASVVELFIDVGREEYIEIEVAPNGVTFEAFYNNGEVKFIESSLLQSKVTTGNKKYIVELSVDLHSFNCKTIRFNAFRIEKRKNGNIILLALNPTMCETFHVKNKFIKL